MNFECTLWAKEQTHNCHQDRPLPSPVLKVSALVSNDLLWDEEPRGHISKMSQNGRKSIQKDGQIWEHNLELFDFGVVRALILTTNCKLVT